MFVCARVSIYTHTHTHTHTHTFTRIYIHLYVHIIFSHTRTHAHTHTHTHSTCGAVTPIDKNDVIKPQKEKETTAAARDSSDDELSD